MIDRITGVLLSKSPTAVVVEVGGVGFKIAVPLSTFEKIGNPGGSTTLSTHLHVREDALELYGFHEGSERDLFQQLLKVAGVGPKLGLAILSRFSPDQLTEVVREGNVKRLATVPGIGMKTGERLMMELRDRIGGRARHDFAVAAGELSPYSQALQALEALGFSAASADDAVRRARLEIGDDAPVEELIRRALKG